MEFRNKVLLVASIAGVLGLFGLFGRNFPGTPKPTTSDQQPQVGFSRPPPPGQTREDGLADAPAQAQKELLGAAPPAAAPRAAVSQPAAPSAVRPAGHEAAERPMSQRAARESTPVGAR